MAENNQRSVNRNKLYAGIVWILSAVAVTIYGSLSASNTTVPGVEDLITYLSTIEGKYIYLAAFVSVLIEGLYLVGSFFPGSSLIILLAIMSQANGYAVFVVTILLIFIGWCIAGFINISVAKAYRSKIIKLKPSEDYTIKDRPWTTWFPSFRASYEVAQVAEGGEPLKVFISSLRVRFWASLFVAGLALLVPLFFDINETTNREGYITLIIVAAISLTVGIMKIKDYRSLANSSKSLSIARQYLGQNVKVVFDRSLGTKHPKHGFVYEVNYGYVPGVLAPDGEDLDAYYLGVEGPLTEALGKCIAIVHRENDDDDKLVVVPEGIELTDEEILALTAFQEKWFKSSVVR